jgi:patatin-like phospholipase/acyl hydrolase
MKNQFNIFSLSGGGIRGLFTVSVLANLENYICEEMDLDVPQTEAYSIAKHFDLSCVTSIGGVIALGLASGFGCRLYLAVLCGRLPAVLAP